MLFRFKQSVIHVCSLVLLVANAVFTPVAIAAPKKSKPTITPETSAASTLSRAETMFKDGQYDGARKIIDARYNDLIADSALKARTLVLKIRLHFVFNEAEQGKSLVQSMDLNELSSSFDPLSDPPELISIVREETQKKSSAKALEQATKKQEPVPLSAIPSNDDSKLRRVARFWLGIMPFGVGHLDTGEYLKAAKYMSIDFGAFYVSSVFRGKENFSAKLTSLSENDRYPNRISELMFMGTWGYEVLDLMPTLLARDHFRANWTRWWMSFLPLGVAQVKNGEPAKGLGLGFAQVSLAVYAMSAKHDHQRSLTRNVLIGTLVYGAYDGWLNHRWITDLVQSDAPTTHRWQVMPTILLSDSSSDQAWLPAISGTLTLP
jgi:hypothetical protein